MMQLILITLSKRKEMIHYYESFGYGGTTLSNFVTNDLTHVSVPTEEGSIISIMGISLHPHHEHFTQCPIVKHKQPNNLINKKRRLTHQNHYIHLLMQFRRGI
jgi:hypothetical protein